MWRFEGSKTLAYYLRRRDTIRALAADLEVNEAFDAIWGGPGWVLLLAHIVPCTYCAVSHGGRHWELRWKMKIN